MVHATLHGCYLNGFGSLVRWEGTQPWPCTGTSVPVLS